MERSSTIGYILIFFLFLGFWFFNKDTVQQIENQGTPNNTTLNIVDSSQYLDAEEISLPNSVERFNKIEEEIITIKNSKLSIDFTNIGAIPKVVNLLDYKKDDSTILLLIDSNHLQFEYSIPLSNGNVINTSEVQFDLIESTENSVSYKYTENGSDIIQSYTLKPNSYKLDYSINFKGFDKKISPNNS